MKVLFISNGYPPHRWAGTETYTAGLARGLVSRHHQVQVLCVGDWDRGDHYWNGYTDAVHDGVPVRRLNLNWAKAPDPARYLYDNPAAARHVADFLDRARPDLVHVTSCETLSASVLREVRLAGLPLVLSLTDFWFLCPRINLLRSDGGNCDGVTTAWTCLECQLADSPAYRWPMRVLSRSAVETILTTISRYPAVTRQRGMRGKASNIAQRKAFLQGALHWPDQLITASAFTRDVYVANGVTRPISIRPYGHDLGWLRKFKGKTPSERIRVGFIGQVIPSKGLHVLLEAARRLQDHASGRFQWLIYGNLHKIPEYGDTLRAQARDLTNVEFCGTYSHDDGAAVFERLDVLAVPSLWYDFPLIIYEAFATGTPVIATNLGGMAEAVQPGLNGLLFDRGDSAALAGQLRRLVDEGGLLARLQAAIAPVKTLNDELDELEATYDGLLSFQRA